MNPNIDATGGLLTPPSISDSELLEQQTKAYAKQRAELARIKYPNAPELINCKICDTKFPNPILEGCNIVIVTCSACRTNMLGDKGKRKALKTGKVSKRQLERAENATTETPAVITADPNTMNDQTPTREPFYLSDFKRDD